jgi:hypothetical protein
MRTILITLLMTLSTQVGAQIFDESFSFKGKNVYVFLQDSAVGGCWTNLREVREYAEEKLRMKGAIIKNDGWDKNTFILKIAVTAGRNPNDDRYCYGMTVVQVADMKYFEEPNRRLALVSERARVILNSNVNRKVLDIISEALAEFK